FRSNLAGPTTRSGPWNHTVCGVTVHCRGSSRQRADRIRRHRRAPPRSAAHRFELSRDRTVVTARWRRVPDHRGLFRPHSDAGTTPHRGGHRIHRSTLLRTRTTSRATDLDVTVRNSNTALELRGVSVGYTATPVISDVHLKVPTGGWLAI